MAKQTKETSSPIFKKILIPMGILIFIEIILLVGSIFGSHVTTHLDQNARDILYQRVVTRKSYLENEMVNNWSNIDLTVQNINKKTAVLAKEGKIDLTTLDDSSKLCTPLILAISNDLISLMRNNRVTGAFVVFNNDDLTTASAGMRENKPGIYIRDLDPMSSPSFRNMDLLLERAPAAVVRKLNISTDSGWTPLFEFKEKGQNDLSFFDEPFQKAFENKDQKLPSDTFGYWSKPYQLYGDNKEVISYSEPLVLEDGTVYGVIGVEITLDYLRKLLPYQELFEDKKGSYILGVAAADNMVFDHALVNGSMYAQSKTAASQTTVRRELTNERDCWIDGEKENEFYASVVPLNLYNSNTPFSDQQWALIGTVRSDDLFAFSSRVTGTLITSILLTLLVGVLGSLIVGRLVSKPVVSLAKDMAAVNPGKTVQLKRTGISEIDRLAVSIENLSRDVMDSATKFTRIMRMASVKIAGFEIKWAEQSLFVTDGFFEIFHMEGIDTKDLTIDSFEQILKGLRCYLQGDPPAKEVAHCDMIYKIPAETGNIFVKLTYNNNGEQCIGLAEDVTRATIERDRIEHERDHDLLTGLLNRRAFHRIMKRIFAQEAEVLKNAALVMMDLDNLKLLNDTYGHDCGDKYIRVTAECFLESTPPETVISRISGDEFYLFFYGYEKKEDIRLQLERLVTGIHKKTFGLPNHELSHIQISGGVAWYPEDSTSYEELLKFSDFAMYKVKQSIKGALSDFDIGVYNKESYLLQNKAELTELLEKSLVNYCFQPIVDARTGKIFAYEALMRADFPTLRMPGEIITLAKLEGKLNQIEVLTWFKALEAFSKKVEEGVIPRDCKIFVNSIANQTMPEDSFQLFEKQYQAYLSNIVLEITEEEQMGEDVICLKRQQITKWQGMLALDDYGSGYNSEKVLLRLVPEFIKVDIAIVRNIDQNLDKQKIVENIVSYGHERGMFIVAEGVETKQEASMVIGLGVDYLQGYWLSKPEFEPPVLSSEQQKQILLCSRQDGDIANQ